MSGDHPVSGRAAARRSSHGGGRRGRVAARRVSTLIEAGAEVVLIAPDVHERVEALAADGLLALCRGRSAVKDLQGAW
ncbi:NAD(P)-dependent oxidoreductase [Micropruina sp.]|uniref:NAD(P)-dependent oxidoreductase n=1 Tax=Micropruina sp. TaxID=2737536 RepID=UPI0039E56F34